MTATAVIAVAMIINLTNGQTFGFGTTVYIATVAWPSLKLAMRLETESEKGSETLPNFRVSNRSTEVGRIVFNRKWILAIFILAFFLRVILWITASIWFKDYVPPPQPVQHVNTPDLSSEAMSRIMSAFAVCLMTVEIGMYFLSCTPRPRRRLHKEAPASLRPALVKSTN
ncbi:MAG: hypothetical protein JWN64_303 [Parcubacteria group bacterium]|nr:hypothetical protein [Parcubacteria group bacterium]